MWEVALIFVVALIVLGPKQLTEVARSAGKLYRDIQRFAAEVRSSVDFDELTATHKPAPPPAAEKPPVESSLPGPFIGADPGERYGPDFYADLLESSKNESPEDTKINADSNSPAEAKTSEPGTTHELDKATDAQQEGDAVNKGPVEPKT
jgi:Sec-independent protein translocase protein TatA